jgi:prepilin-type processing-associated H-X9-DG protein
MRRTLHNALWALALCIVVCAFAFPYFARQRQNSASFSCQSNLKNLGIAMAQYTQDYNGKFPVARLGWADAIQPYVKTVTLGCPLDRNTPFFLRSARLGVYTPNTSGDYNAFWYNAHLSGAAKPTLSFPRSTLLLGERNDGTDVKDVHYSKTALPPAWLQNPEAPPWRHLGGANYLYTDGHVQWLKPTQVTANFGRANCFAIK